MTIKSNQDELIDDLCAQAEASHRAGDLQSARQIYEAVLQLDPESERAREGLALASLTDNNWSLMERAGSHDALVARAREALASGLIDQAAQLAEELQQRAPADARITALQQEISAVRAIAPRIEQLLGQAREALATSRPSEAATFCRQALELDPASRDAELLLEQAERAAPAAPAPSNDLSLELDLDLAMPGLTPPAPAPPPRPALDPNATVRTTLPVALALDAMPAVVPAPPAPPAPAAAPAKPPRSDANVWDAGEFARDLADITDRPTRPKHDDMEDLLDAARDLDQPIEVPEDRDTLQPTGPSARAEGEAALLVARAREEFDSGRHEDARQLASQALALNEHATGAQDILDDVRAVSDRAAREADNLINQAISDIENKRPDLAVPLLKQSLMLAPGHAEALDYLERAERECESMNMLRQGTPEDAVYGETHAPENVAAIPLGESGYRRATSVAPEAPHAGAPSPAAPPAPGAPSATLVPGTAAPPVPPPPPPAAPAVAPGPRMGGAPPAPPPRPAPTGKASKGAARLKLPPVLANGASKIVTWLVLVVVAAGLGVGRRVVFGFLGGLFSGSSSTTTANEPVKRPAKKAAPGAAAAVAPVPAGAAAAAPSYTKDDVPSLLQQAQARLAGGDEAGAVALLTAARQADANSFEVVERLEKARAALRLRQDADARIKEARERYAQEDFEEALRILYRIPQAYHPAGLNTWIANGWYNVGVQRLQTGDLREAIEFFGNCLEVRPGDEGATRNRELARRYLGKSTDDAYRIYVKGLALRTMDAR